MRQIILFLFSLITIVSVAQTPYVRYDYGTYGGSPIQTGWLLNDNHYNRIYDKLMIQTQLIGEYKTKSIQDSLIILNQAFGLMYEKTRVSERDTIILDCTNKLTAVVAKSDSIYAISQTKIPKSEHQKKMVRGIAVSAVVFLVLGWYVGSK